MPFPSLPVLAEALGGVPSPELEGARIEAAVLVCLHDETYDRTTTITGKHPNPPRCAVGTSMGT